MTWGRGVAYVGKFCMRSCAEVVVEEGHDQVQPWAPADPPRTWRHGISQEWDTRDRLSSLRTQTEA